MLDAHKTKSVKYDKALKVIGSTKTLAVPTMDNRDRPYPLVKVQSGVECSQGHISIAKRIGKSRKCLHDDCQCEMLNIIAVQEIGRKRIKLCDSIQREESLAIGCLGDEQFLNSITCLEEKKNDCSSSTRKTRQIENVIDIEKLFPKTQWTDENLNVSQLKSAMKN